MCPTHEFHLVLIANSSPERFELVNTSNDDEGLVTAYGPINERDVRVLMLVAGIDPSVIDATIREARQRATQRSNR